MDRKKSLAVLVAFCLAATLFLAIPTRSSPTANEYDPWADINDDGKINMYDIGYTAQRFGASGEPINKTDLLFQLEARIAALEALGSVTTDKIAEGAVITTKLADGSVTTAKILDGTILTVDLADGSVTSVKIVNGAVTTTRIADSAVTTSKIADNAIVTIKLADGSVTSAKILDGTITSADLADGAVTKTDILDGAVSTNKIANSAVTTDKIADDAVTGAKIADGAVTWGSIAGKPLEVVAAGFITSGATVTTGYNIQSVTWDAGYSRYTIVITGVNYFYSDYITIVTCAAGECRTAVTNSLSGQLIVSIFDSTGSKVQENFQFVTYRIA